MCFSCQLDEPCGFSGDHLQNAAMLQCASQYLQSISVAVSLLYSVGNEIYNYCYCHCYCYYCYYVYDRGCWHMCIDPTPGSVPSRTSSSYCLLAGGQTLPYLTGLNWFAILHRFLQFKSLLRQIQIGISRDRLHMLNSSCKAVSSAVAPHIHWITSCSSASMHRSLSLGLRTTGTVDRKGPRWQPCNFSMGHGSHASKGILTAKLTSTVPSADDCFCACRWYIHWTSDYFLILFKLCSVWRLKYNITSAVQPEVWKIILVSQKFQVGLGKLICWGKWCFFSKLWWCCPSWMSPWMLATPAMV